MSLTIGDVLDAVRPVPLVLAVVAWLIGSILSGVARAAAVDLWNARRSGR